MSICEKSLKGFIDEVASKTPVPGGGAVGAVVGALAAALTEMVANLTLGKKKYQEWEGEMEKVIENMEKLREDLCTLAKRDIEAFDKVMDAMKLPKDTEDQKAKRSEEIQKALKGAADVPYELSRKVRDVIKFTEIVVEFGNKNAISDALSAAELCRASFEIAKANVLINLKSLKDEKNKKYYSEEIDEIEKQVYGSYKRIKEIIEKNGWL